MSDKPGEVARNLSRLQLSLELMERFYQEIQKLGLILYVLIICSIWIDFLEFLASYVEDERKGGKSCIFVRIQNLVTVTDDPLQSAN